MNAYVEKLTVDGLMKEIESELKERKGKEKRKGVVFQKIINDVQTVTRDDVHTINRNESINLERIYLLT